MLGLVKSYAPLLLALAAGDVVAVNSLHASEHGFAIPMLVFIGVSLFLLLRWAQVIAAEAQPASPDADAPFHHRWWAALLAALIGVFIVLLAGLSIRGVTMTPKLGA